MVGSAGAEDASKAIADLTQPSAVRSKRTAVRGPEEAAATPTAACRATRAPWEHSKVADAGSVFGAILYQKLVQQAQGARTRAT